MSCYPDGSFNNDYERLRVVLPRRDSPAHTSSKVQLEEIEAVVCHKKDAQSHEQYLVRWKSNNPSTTVTPYSWHYLNELEKCLPLVQSYIDALPSITLPRLNALSEGRKRRNDDDSQSDRSTSVPRTSSSHTTASFASSRTSPTPSLPSELSQSDGQNVYFGQLWREQGVIHVRGAPNQELSAPVPTESMRQRAAQTETRQAQYDIRTKFDMEMRKATASAKEPIDIVNQIDGSRPPLIFKFIDKSVLGQGVQAADPGTITGCGMTTRNTGSDSSSNKTRCRPDMGQKIGCEYARVCECLEFAAVVEEKLTPAERTRFKKGETEGLPKRFPYLNTGLLQSFYLQSRHAIYECNPQCLCEAGCKTRLVQKGRQVPLQIFKTEKRGWGLRCQVNLVRGQFVDTYRGEIITDAEATKRENAAGLLTGLKSSYLYSLDKHAVDDDLAQLDELKRSDCYVVDGETQGGPARFINHSCEPNLRQFSVQYNRFDQKVYELAFFALHNIPAMTELTFDYMDNGDDEDDDDNDNDADMNDCLPSTQDSATGGAAKQAMRCYCGSARCRKTLWM